MLRRFSAEKRASRDATTLGDPRNDLGDTLGNELAARDVVEKEQRLRADAHDVIDDHRDGVDPDGVVTAECLRDEQLGPDTVRSRNQDGVLEIWEPPGERTGKPSDASDHFWSCGDFRELLYERNCVVAGAYVDAGLPIRVFVRTFHRVRCSCTSSSTNFGCSGSSGVWIG